MDQATTAKTSTDEYEKIQFCPYCGNKLDKGANFCKDCGKSIGQVKEKYNFVKDKPITERKVVYEGYIHKCPNCGDILDAFVSKCPSCGNEVRDIQSSEVVKNFSLKLIDTKSEKQKIALIRNFPIPNTKEDIFEFMILASSNYDANYINEDNQKKEMANAWLTKIEQCNQKAKVIFNDKNDLKKIQELYQQTCEMINEATQKWKKKSELDFFLRTIGLWGGLLIFVFAFFIDVFSTADTSVYHLGAGVIMIVGAFVVGRKSKELIDVGIGVGCGTVSIILGTLLQEKFMGNGSVMELAGGATIIIVIVRMISSFRKK